MSITGDRHLAVRVPTAIDNQRPWAAWDDLVGYIKDGKAVRSEHPINDKAKSGKRYGALVNAICYSGWNGSEHVFQQWVAQAAGQNFNDTWLHAGNLPMLSQEEAIYIWTQVLGKELVPES